MCGLAVRHPAPARPSWKTPPAALATITIDNRLRARRSYRGQPARYQQLPTGSAPAASQFPPFVYPRISLARAGAYCLRNSTPPSRAGAHWSENSGNSALPSRTRVQATEKSILDGRQRCGASGFLRFWHPIPAGSDRQVLRRLPPLGHHRADAAPLGQGFLRLHPMPVSAVLATLGRSASGGSAVHPAPRFSAHRWRLARGSGPRLSAAPLGRVQLRGLAVR